MICAIILRNVSFHRLLHQILGDIDDYILAFTQIPRKIFKHRLLKTMNIYNVRVVLSHKELI